VQHGIEFEMLLGMATGQAEAVKKDVGGLLLYTPVVHPKEFDVAIAYLIRRLEEGASQDNFMSAVFELSSNEALFEREKGRFLASLSSLDRGIPLPRRSQDRTVAETASTNRFVNAADTDPSLPANRAWSAGILDRVAGSTLGVATVASSVITEPDTLDPPERHGAPARQPSARPSCIARETRSAPDVRNCSR
jgi:RHH-type proline utilization regulon transcriptional repressor/proline dehydrogenase/delta 1-pyrroline-5-carboxylate dehydrogenase